MAKYEVYVNYGEYSWNFLKFIFDSLEEANEFVNTLMSSFIQCGESTKLEVTVSYCSKLTKVFGEEKQEEE